MSVNPLIRLHDEGVSPWLDNLSRDMFRTGRLERLIREEGMRGQTSNPTIFQKAISQGEDYDEQIVALSRKGMSPEEICWELMVTDVQSACDVFRPLYDSTGGREGLVSLELNPTLAREVEQSLVQARELVARVGRPNLLIKVPATREGLPVGAALLAEGISVNFTLLFAVARYGEVIEAFFQGLEKRAEAGLPLEGIESVASFFVSRVDSEADKRMDRRLKEDPSLQPAVAALRGTVAVANARLAYGVFEEKFGSERWKALAARGARVQRPLWASTSTKNPAYPDTIYVAELIGPECVNTMPDDTVDAFRDHGVVQRTLTAENLAEARRVMEKLAAVGVDLDDMTLNTLEEEGVRKFADSYRDLVDAVRAEVEKLAGRA